MSLNSFSYTEGGNFRIKVLNNGVALANVNGTILNDGVTTPFITDASGITQFFTLNEAITSVVVTIPPFDNFGNKVVNHTFTPNEILEVSLAESVNIDFTFLRGQPIRFVNQDGSKGLDKRLLVDMTLGGDRNIKNACYDIIRIRSKDEYISIKSSSSINVVKIFNQSDVQVGQDIAMANVRTDVYQAVFNWETLSIPNGRYYLKMVLGNTQELISEPIVIQNDESSFGLIEYTNAEDRDGIVFTLDPKPQYYIVAPFDLLDEISEEDPITFVNDRNESTLLYDEVSELKRLKTNKEIPFYLWRNIQIALGYDDAKVNGDSFIKTEQGSIEPFEDISHLFNYEVLLRRKEFESQNFN